MTNQVRLGDIFEFKNGRAFKKTEWSTSGLPIIRIQNLNKAHAPYNYYLGDYDKRIEVNNGDLLFSWSGTVGSSFGPHIWPGGVGVLNQHIFRVSLKDGIEKRYAYYALLDITSEIEKSVSGAVGIVHVTQSNLKNFKIPVPSASEQKRIVAILDEAFDGIDAAFANAEKNLANVRELFEGYLDSVFNQRNEEWSIKTVGDFAELRLGKMLDKQKNRGLMRPYLRNINVQWFEIKTDNTLKMRIEEHEIDKYSVHRGDLLICEGGYPGRAAIWDKDEAIFFQKALHRVRCKDMNYNKWLLYYLYLLDCNGQISQYFTGAGIQHFTGKALKTLQVPLPPKHAVYALVDEIEKTKEEIDRLKSIYQKKLALLNELKKSLLKKAFSGELTADNVVEITTIPLETNTPEFAAHIMAAAYHWHASEHRGKTFGRVKAQKTLHLVESLADIDLGRQPIKDAAGPNDFQHMQRAEEWAKDHGFFEFVKRPTGQRGYDFRKGARYGELVAEAIQALAPYEAVLKRVVKILMPLNTAETEILATVYAAWNNLLLEGIEPSENAIIHEARENWHADKLKYSEEQFRNAISQLRHNGLVPQGRGKRVTGQESLAL